MTASEYYRAVRRVSTCGNLLCGVTGFSFLVMLLWATDVFSDDIVRLGKRLEHSAGETLAVLIEGLLLVLACSLPLAGSALAVFWFDGRIGCRCSHCGGSVTLRCRWRDVLQTGRCGLCGRELFEVDATLVAETHVKPLNTTTVVWWMTGIAVASFAAACFVRHPVTSGFFVPTALLVSWVGAGIALYSLVRTPSRQLWLAAVFAVAAAVLAALPYWYESTGRSLFPEGTPAWPRISVIESRPGPDNLSA